MKIGLFFGKFNPIHNGHIGIIAEAILYNKFDKVVIVPRMQSPLQSETLLDINERIRLIKTSLLLSRVKKNDIPLFRFCEVSEIEKEMIPPYYTYATFEALKNKYYGNDVYFICGYDTMKEVKNWMHGEYMLQNNKFLEFPMTSEDSKDIRELAKASDFNKLNKFVPTWLIKRIIVDYKELD